MRHLSYKEWHYTKPIAMVKNEKNIVELDWDTIPSGTGKFEAVIVGGELKHFMGFSPLGSLDIYTNDYKFLLALRDRINEVEEQVKLQVVRTIKQNT